MFFLAYFIFVFSVIQLFVAAANLVFRQNFSNRKSGFKGLVSVLIPARNEEKIIGNLLSNLQNQDYQNIEILVFNDLSIDKTAEIITGFSLQDNRIKLINSNGLPEGWLGKNFACHSLARIAKGDFYLFLDADVNVSKGIIVNTIEMSLRHKLSLLSIFPKQMMKSLGERMTVPNMNFILLSLLPLIWVRKLGFSSMAAANGQCMLFEAMVYKATQPHEKMKMNKVEDIEIARFLKHKKHKIACLAGDETISCRMYESFDEAINGFSKNVINFFGNSFFVAIIFWLTTTFGFLAVWFLLGAKALLVYLLIILTTRIFISIVSKQNIIWNTILLIPQQLALGMMIYKALINESKKSYEWKGRNIS